MLSLVFLGSSIFFGYAVLRSFQLNVTRLERWVWGTTFGLVTVSYLGLLSAYLGGWNSASQLAACLVILGVGLWLYFRYRNKPSDEQLGHGKLAFLPVLIVAAIVIFFGSTTLTERAGEWWINNANNYGDIRLHLAYITNFISGLNIPVENPIFSGSSPSYPFLINVLAAQLVTLGMSIPIAINTTSLIFLAVIALVMYCFVLRLTQQRFIASLAPFILFTNGGISAFTLLIPDWINHNFSLAYLTQTTHDYAIFQGYVFGNTVTTFFGPQRAFLLGFPIVMIVLTELWKLNRKSLWQQFLFIGLCIATLPLVHTSSLLVVALLLPFFFLKNWREKEHTKQFITNWLALTLPASVIGFFLLHVFISQASSLTSYLRFQSNWIADQGPFLYFWIHNAGPALVIAVIGLFLAWKRKEVWQPFIVYSFILFFLANFVITQPWDFDNSKYLVYWYACLTVVIGWTFYLLAEKKQWIVIGVLILLISLTGSVDLLRRTQISRNWYPILLENEFDLAENLQQVIPPQSRVLTIGDKMDSITPLLGRRLVFGDDPWLWSHGIRSYKERIRDVHAMYMGGSQTAQLLRQYGVDYVIISNNERQREPRLNEPYFASRYERVYTDSSNFNVYKIGYRS